METFGVLEDCYIPDTNISHNILFDSCVYDKRLLHNSKDIQKLKKMINIGFSYYYTIVQEREIIGVPDRKLKYNELWSPNPNAARELEILKSIEAKRISCYGHVMYSDFVILDGTYRPIESKNNPEKRVQMFYSIFNDNLNHLRDAIIAEAAIYNNCTFVSADKRPVNIVNQYFPKRALLYDNFIQQVGE